MTSGDIKNDLDWKNEAGLLDESGVSIYPVQALNRRSSNYFYSHLSQVSGTPHLMLNQFREIPDYISALCYARAGKLPEFEESLNKRGSVSYNVGRVIDSLAGRKAKPHKPRCASIPRG